MTNTHKFSAAAAFGAAALFSMLSFGNNAEAAKTLSSCIGSTAGKVVSCCGVLTKAGRPMWMIETKTNCRKATVCRKGVNLIGIAAVVPHCYIQVIDIQDDRGRDKADGRRSGLK